MARRRFQSGCLFKRGKRRKVWVARWRETVLLEGGKGQTVARAVMLGTVGELPKKGDAQIAVRGTPPANQPGNGRPEAFYGVRHVCRGAMENAGASDLQALDATRVQDRARRAPAAPVARMAAPGPRTADIQ